MDTKSKNINHRYSIWIKLLAIFLGLAGATMLFFGLTKWRGVGFYLDDMVSGQNSTFLKKDRNGDYSASGLKFISDMHRVAEVLYQANVFYQSEEHIKSGETATSDRITALQQSYLQDFNNMASSTYSDYSWQLQEASAAGDEERARALEQERDERIAYYEQVYQTQKAGAKQEIIDNDLLEYENVRKAADEIQGYCYTVFDLNGNYVSGKKLSREDYEKLPFYLTGRRVSDQDQRYWSSVVNLDMPDNQVLYIGLEQSEYDRLQAAYRDAVEAGKGGLIQIVVGFGILLFSLNWVLMTAGRKKDTGKEIHLTILDRPYLDILFLFCTICVIFLMVFTALILRDNTGIADFENYQISTISDVALMTMGVASFWGIYLLGLWLLSSVVKRIRRGEASHHTLIYRIFRLIKRLLRRLFRGVRNFFRVMGHRHPLGRYAIVFGGINLVLAVLVSFFSGSVNAFFVLVVFGGGATALEAYAVKKRAVALESLRQDIDVIKDGQLNHKARSTGVEDIDQIALRVNNLSDGLKNAVEQQVKSERMKVELITNVSHDLKTPLTSMVNYLDLLKNEQLTPEYANDYVKVIDQKLNRLRLMVQDLFDIAKVQSGNMEMHLERIDLNDLIEQSLAENEDRMRQNNLTFRVNMPKEHIFIKADGRKLWRVFDNLIGNAVKYSLDNTRVYIDVAKGNCATVSIKNVANYEMDFDATEIVERFSRADKARSTEGSGLGLSIAKSFLRAQGGTLAVAVDGDLFKVNVTMPLFPQAPPPPKPPAAPGTPASGAARGRKMPGEPIPPVPEQPDKSE